MKENEIPLFPVAHWQTGPVPAFGIVVFRPNFLTHPTQKPENANPGRMYGLTADQARQLIGDLQRALEVLEKARSGIAANVKH